MAAATNGMGFLILIDRSPQQMPAMDKITIQITDRKAFLSLRLLALISLYMSLLPFCLRR